MDRFQMIKENPPRAGNILRTPHDWDVEVSVVTKTDGDGSKKAMMCRAVVDKERGYWVLSSEQKGIVCLILPESQGKLRKVDGVYVVKALRVIRYHSTGKSMLCEVVE